MLLEHMKPEEAGSNSKPLTTSTISTTASRAVVAFVSWRGPDTFALPNPSPHRCISMVKQMHILVRPLRKNSSAPRRETGSPPPEPIWTHSTLLSLCTEEAACPGLEVGFADRQDWCSTLTNCPCVPRQVT